MRANRIAPVKCFVLCMVIGVLIVGLASAQPPSKASVVGSTEEPSMQGTRWALLVGVAEYPRTASGYEIQPLQAPVKDVNALAALLKDPSKGRFEADQIVTLTDAQATRRNILITFNDIVRQAKPEDLVLFYFSGHGYRASDGESTYLIPHDLDVRDFAATCINFDDLAIKIRKMAAKKVVVILDACHAGGVKPQGARAAGTTGLVERYLNAFQNAQGRALLLSSDESEVSWETEDHGVFTRFLLDGLRGQADADEDGIVTFTEASLYVEREVPKYTLRNFPRVQQPTRRYDLGQVRGDIPLAINPESRTQFLADQEQQMTQRTEAILRASLSGLSNELKELSLQTIRTAHDKGVHGESLTEQESLLLSEMDSLRSGTITVQDYAQRARIISQLEATSSEPAPPSMGSLLVDVQPTDAEVTVRTLDGTTIQSRDLFLSPVGATKMSSESKPLPVGTYRVIAQKEGYNTTVQTIEITTDGPTRVTVILEPLEKAEKPAEEKPQESEIQPQESPAKPPPTGKIEKPTTRPLRPQKAEPPRGFVGFHVGPYTPVEEGIADSYGKPWPVGGIDIGWRIAKPGIYMVLSGSYTQASGDWSNFASFDIDEIETTLAKTFSRLGIRVMNRAGSDEHMMYVFELLATNVLLQEDVSAFGYEDTIETNGAGLALGVGIRYKAFELRTLADFIRKDEVWLAGYNLTVGLVWNIQ